ncbi:MAG: PfkB family carbohydrate kinase [Caldilineaceae bacterium]|nr:PfkB family carbohydrate kinase [Caldilineaceae bacterium]
MFDVVGLGCACVDFLGVVPYMPGLDDEIQMLAASRQGGGEVATALVALTRLGSTASYVGQIGDDPSGDLIATEFEQYGVDTSHLLVERGATSQTSIVLVDVESGKRTILGVPFTASEIAPDQIRPGFVEKARYLLLDGTARQAALEAARRARSAGVPVVLDADVVALDSEIEALLDLTDILIPSKSFSQRFTGTENVEKALETLRTFGASIILITLGEEGCVCYADGDTFHTPIFEVEVVDTTGAGDVFHGAFVRGLLQDWELPQTVEFAAAVAAIKCAKLGGRAGIPTAGETASFLAGRETQFDYSQLTAHG